jgi:hypothetical protein
MLLSWHVRGYGRKKRRLDGDEEKGRRGSLIRMRMKKAQEEGHVRGYGRKKRRLDGDEEKEKKRKFDKDEGKGLMR